MDSCQSDLIATLLSACKCMMFHDNGRAGLRLHRGRLYQKVLKSALLLHIDTPMKQLQKDILASKAPT